MYKYLVLHDNKNGKDRMVPISEHFVIICEEYLKHGEQYRINYNSGRFFYKTQRNAFRQ
jgi:site-specific recombinase XerD